MKAASETPFPTSAHLYRRSDVVQTKWTCRKKPAATNATPRLTAAGPDSSSLAPLLPGSIALRVIQARRPKRLSTMAVTTPPAMREKVLPEAVPDRLSAKSTSAFRADRLNMLIVLCASPLQSQRLQDHAAPFRRIIHPESCRRGRTAWYGASRRIPSLLLLNDSGKATGMQGPRSDRENGWSGQGTADCSASVTLGKSFKTARRSLSLQGFPGPSVPDGGRDSVEPPHETEALPEASWADLPLSIPCGKVVSTRLSVMSHAFLTYMLSG